MHESTISNWENGLREPNLEKLLFISKYFNVGIDYLLNNIVAIEENYIKVNETFPGCIEFLHKASKNINIEKRDKIIKLLKLYTEIQI